jgi:hypothetical protein
MRRKNPAADAARMRPDASSAVANARAGQCRDAMKHLFDAAPNNQDGNCSNDGKSAKDFRHAAVIVAGLCTVNKKAGIKYTGFGRARRRKRK